MLNIVLVEPEIPQNCGNIARTCAATGSRLHLIRPLGFDISERAVRRAGLDYWHLVTVRDYDGLDDLFRQHPEAAADLWLATTKAPQDYTQARFTPDSWIFFGKETAGLPEWFRTAHRERCIRLPMREEARSLNLSNSVAILTYEALRQNHFPGLLGTGEMKNNINRKYPVVARGGATPLRTLMKPYRRGGRPCFPAPLTPLSQSIKEIII